MRERLDLPRVGAAVSVMFPKTHAAHRAAGVPDDIARDAAVEIGSLAVPLTVVKWMVDFMPGLHAASVALRLRIAHRLD